MSDQHSQAGPSREGYRDGGRAPGEGYPDPALGHRGPFAAEHGPAHASRPGSTGGAGNPGTWRDPLPGGPADGFPGAWSGAVPDHQGPRRDGYPAEPPRDGYPAEPSRDGLPRPDTRHDGFGDGFAQPVPVSDGRGRAEPAVDALGLPITPLAERHAPPQPGGPAPLEPRYPGVSSTSAAYDPPQAAPGDQRDVRPLDDTGPTRESGSGVWHDDPEATIVTGGNGPQEGLRTLVELARASEGHTDAGPVGDTRPGEGRPDNAYDLPPLGPSADQARQGGPGSAYGDAAPYPSETPARYPAEDPARSPTRAYPSSADPLPPREGPSPVDPYPSPEGSSSLDSYPPRDGASSPDSYPPRDGASSSDSYPSRDGFSSADPYPSPEGSSSLDSYPPRDGASSSDSYPSRDGFSSADPYPSPEGSSSLDSYPPRDGASSSDSYPSRDGFSSVDPYPSPEGSSSLDSYPSREDHSSLDQYPQSFDVAPQDTREALPYLGGQSSHGLEPRHDSAHSGPDRGPAAPPIPHSEASRHEALRPETPPVSPDTGDQTLQNAAEGGHGRVGEAGPVPAPLPGADGQADASPYAPPADASMGEVAALAEQFAQRFDLLAQNVERIIKGKRQTVELALVCLFAEGHLLIEDVPGTGKSTLARSIAASVDGLWRHIQLTPDLEPVGIIGAPVRDAAGGTTELRRGPVFANLVLCDGIEHAAPKTLAALLEAMEERRIVVDSETHALPRPFMVIATQDSTPVHGDGPPSLPKARLDRFLMRISIGYPDPAAEVEALKSMPAGPQVDRLPLVARASDIAGMIDFTARIHVADPIYDYVVSLVAATRGIPETRLGASPRAAMALVRASRVRAAAAGRHYVVPEDVRALAVPVLAHRLMLTPEAEARGRTGATVVEEIVARVAAPQLAGV